MKTTALVLAAFVLLPFSHAYSDDSPDVARLKKAADWGDKEAAYQLYQKYEKGDGVARNHQEAQFWYNLSGRAVKPEPRTDAPKAQAEDTSRPHYREDDFISVLGRIDAGVTLYDKRTKEPWGIITDVPSWGKVTVARVDASSLASGHVRGAVSVYDRDYITANYVTLRK